MAVAQVTGRPGRRQIALVAGTDEVTLAVVQAVVWCRRLGEGLRRGHGNVSKHLISSTSWLQAVKCLGVLACEGEVAFAGRLSQPGEVAGGRSGRVWGAGASGEVSQGLTTLYRVGLDWEDGFAARNRRLMGLQGVSRRSVCSRCASVVRRAGRRVRAGGRFSRDESTSLIHSAGLGCGRWLDDDTGTGAARKVGDNITAAKAMHTCNAVLLLYAVSDTAGPSSSRFLQCRGRALQQQNTICLVHLQVGSGCPAKASPHRNQRYCFALLSSACALLD
jgi:hypothetical protein